MIPDLTRRPIVPPYGEGMDPSALGQRDAMALPIPPNPYDQSDDNAAAAPPPMPAIAPPAPPDVRPDLGASLASKTPGAATQDPGFAAFLARETQPQLKHRERSFGENLGNALSAFGAGLQGRQYEDTGSQQADAKFMADQLADPNSDESKRARAAHAPLLKSLGLTPDEMQYMSAADIKQMGTGNLVEGLLRTRQSAAQQKAAAEAKAADEARANAEWERRHAITAPEEDARAAARATAEMERETARETAALERAKLGKRVAARAGGGGGGAQGMEPLPASVDDTAINRDRWSEIQKIPKLAERARAAEAFLKDATKPTPMDRTAAAEKRGQQTRASNIAKLSVVREVGESEINASFDQMEKLIKNRGSALGAKLEGGAAGLIGMRGAVLPDEAAYRAAKEQMIAASEKMVTMGVPHSEAVTRAIHNLPDYTSAGALEQIKGVREMFKSLSAAGKKALEEATTKYAGSDVFPGQREAQPEGGKIRVRFKDGSEHDLSPAMAQRAREAGDAL